MNKFVSTTAQNVSARLFWRYAAVYAAASVVGALTSARDMTLPFLGVAGRMELWLTALAAVAALLLVSNAYLLMLSAFRGFLDAQLVYRIVLLVRANQVGFWLFNACFLLLAVSLMLFLITGASAARFSYENHGRDFDLILSKPFGCYFIRTLVLIALAWVVCFLWSRTLTSLPTL